jgi:hypothetical protein
MISTRAVHEEKHSEPRIAAEDGMQIDVSEEHSQKTTESIRVSSDGDSNAMSRRELHWKKQRAPISTTELGMQMERSDEQPQTATQLIR